MAGEATSADDAKNKFNSFVTGRGVAGALFLALPMLMTMEMWYLGFTIARERLLLLLLLNIPLLILLAHRIGFEQTFTCRDAIIAYGIGIVTSVIVLAALDAMLAGTEGDRVIEENDVTFDYVAAESKSTGAILFENDPAGHTVDIRPAGYTAP